jgi:hypothetical protein
MRENRYDERRPARPARRDRDPCPNLPTRSRAARGSRSGERAKQLLEVDVTVAWGDEVPAALLITEVEMRRENRSGSVEPLLRVLDVHVVDAVVEPYAKRVPSFRLAGLAEVAQLLGATKRTASRYTALPDFPEPVARLAMGPVWLAEDIEAWARQRGPIRPGRPQRRR